MRAVWKLDQRNISDLCWFMVFERSHRLPLPVPCGTVSCPSQPGRDYGYYIMAVYICGNGDGRAQPVRVHPNLWVHLKRDSGVRFWSLLWWLFVVHSVCMSKGHGRRNVRSYAERAALSILLAALRALC